MGGGGEGCRIRLEFMGVWLVRDKNAKGKEGRFER